MKDDTELFQQYSDNPDFKRRLADTVFGMTYGEGRAPAPDSSASTWQRELRLFRGNYTFTAKLLTKHLTIVY
jgi:hypothetical protein